jgi:two-component system, cell cycle response regulator
MTTAYHPRTRILLGDSNEETARSLCQMLESWNYEVDLARSGSEVLLKLAEPHSAAIILLDAMLTGTPAIDVLHKLRQSERRKRMWTILLTNSADPDLVQMAVDAGVDDLVARPLQEQDLKVRLHTAERMRVLQEELNHSLERARFYNLHDKLTGVLTRETILSNLFRETDRVQRMRTPLCFMLLNLDNFTQLNAEWGIEAGDRILQMTVERFQRYLRSYDLIGRMGEDEFLIALPGCNKEDGLMLAERLRKLVFQKPFDLGFRTVEVSASFGLSQSRGRSPLVVLREAEQALYYAKALGPNYIFRFGDKVPSKIAEEQLNTSSAREKAALRSSIPDAHAY